MERVLEESRQSVTCAICTDVFDDPRILSCSHSFCLHCLIEFRGPGDDHANKFCPICRELTVPSIGQIPSLTKNEFASKVALLIKDTETPRVNVSDEVGAVGGEEMYKGDLLKERPELRDAKRVGIGASVAAGVAVTAATGGLFGVVAGLAVFGLGTLRSVGVEQRKKNMYQCGGCRKDKFSVVRYRCGVCDDFFLCPRCFENSAGVSQQHNAQHFFLKLKSPQKRFVPPGPVLKPKIDDMVQTIDFRNSKHGRAYVHSPQRIVILPAIQCKFCGIMPITGVRYKCGMCNNYDLCPECESTSESIHDKNHVFIAMKNHSEINITSENLLSAHFY